MVDPNQAVLLQVEKVTSIQVRLVAIWSDLLRESNVGLDDDFFVLGGDSLEVVTLMTHIQTEFDVLLDPVEILDAPTIRVLAELVYRATAASS